MFTNVINNNFYLSKKEKKIDNQKSAITYEEVYDKVDLEYEISSNQIKESIVLNSKQDKNKFEFIVDTDGLFPKKENDGSITLYEDKECTKPVSSIAFNTRALFSSSTLAVPFITLDTVAGETFASFATSLILDTSNTSFQGLFLKPVSNYYYYSIPVIHVKLKSGHNSLLL